MKKKCLLLTFVLALASTAMVSKAEEAKKANAIPEEILTILENAEEIELYSLDPEDEDKPEVLGKTVIKDAECRKKLVAEFKKGIEDSGEPAKCFWPRHTIKAKSKDKEVALVICFQCKQVYCYMDGKKTKTLLTSDKPQAYFDQVLEAAGVKLAPKPKK